MNKKDKLKDIIALIDNTLEYQSQVTKKSIIKDIDNTIEGVPHDDYALCYHLALFRNTYNKLIEELKELLSEEEGAK